MTQSQKAGSGRPRRDVATADATLPGRGRILVLDESDAQRRFLTMLLDAEGYQVRALAPEAWPGTDTSAWAPDLAVVETRLLNLIDRTRRHGHDGDGRARHHPLLLCAAAEHELDALKEWSACPCMAVLLKPFDVDEFLACVARLLRADGGDGCIAMDGA